MLSYHLCIISLLRWLSPLTTLRHLHIKSQVMEVLVFFTYMSYFHTVNLRNNKSEKRYFIIIIIYTAYNSPIQSDIYIDIILLKRDYEHFKLH